jgi:PAS domain S-box-containing protein
VKSSDLYKLFFEEAGDALLGFSLTNGNIFCVNPAFCALSGFVKDEIEGESLAALASAHQGENDARERRLSLEIVSTPGFYNDIALSTREGQIKYVSLRVRHVQADSQTMALVVLQDETERQLLMRDLATKHQSLEMAFIDLEKMHSELKATQEKMFQASKLVALGELAAGMSHELNQPLTGIRGFAQEIHDIIKSEPRPSKKKLRELAGEIMTNSDKMASLLSHLRDFARKEKHKASSKAHTLEAVSLRSCLESVGRLFTRQLEKANIYLDCKSIGAELAGLAEAHPLEQVLINLIANSRDAIIEKRQSDKTLKGHILFSSKVIAGHLEIRIQDNGCGVATDLKSKIFDPFFSTKDHAKGMGLGLSISFGIIHQFGGELSLENSGPSGSTFLIKLKSAQAKAEQVAA